VSSARAANSAAGVDGVPAYQPSRTIKRSADSLYLLTPDSVTRVLSAYPSTIAGSGWVTVSKVPLGETLGETFTVKRGTVVASIDIAPKEGGASISIAAYSTR
jgi:hypothetical protein